jgi:drug/metabolite transporter (DMT)-like permease
MYERDSKANAYLLPGILTITASFTPIFAKITVAEISPLSLGFLRFGLAAVLFYITLLIRKSNLKFENKDYLKLVLLGALCIPVNQFFFLKGISMSYASHSGIIFSLNPVFAYITAVIRKQEKFYISKVFAILLTVTGIFFVFYEAVTKNQSGIDLLTGDIFLLFAVLSFSLYITLGKEFIDKYGTLKVTTFGFIAGSVLNIPVFLFDMKNLDLSNVTFSGAGGFLYLAIVMSYIAYFIWYQALKSIKVSMLTTITNLSPIITILFSIILLHESISVFFILGGLITVAGVLIMHKVSIELA